MSVQPALVVETVEATEVLEGIAPKPASGRFGMERVNWTGTIILILCALTVLLPLYVTVMMAFKTTAQAVDGNAFSLPAPFSVEGFVTAWNLTNFPVGAAMSVLVTAGTVVATIFLAAFASYAIVRNWDRKFFRYSFFYLLAAMFIPFPVVALPQVQLTGLVGLANPVGVIILAHHVPAELQRAAVHGVPALDPVRAGGERAHRRGDHVADVLAHDLPAARADERDDRHLRVPVRVERLHDALAHHRRPGAADPAGAESLFQSQFSNNYNVSFASYLMAMAPAIIVYLFTQRWVMEGVTQGAVKG